MISANSVSNDALYPIVTKRFFHVPGAEYPEYARVVKSQVPQQSNQSGTKSILLQILVQEC